MSWRFSSTDWWANGDPLHALTVRPDVSNFKTVCSVDWNPPAANMSLASNNFAVTIIARTFNQMQVPTVKAIDTQRPCCTVVP